MTRLSFHAAELLLIAYKARARAIADGEYQDVTTESIMAIVMSVAATEAFINELAGHALAGILSWSNDVLGETISASFVRVPT